MYLKETQTYINYLKKHNEIGKIKKYLTKKIFSTNNLDFEDTLSITQLMFMKTYYDFAGEIKKLSGVTETTQKQESKLRQQYLLLIKAQIVVYEAEVKVNKILNNFSVILNKPTLMLIGKTKCPTNKKNYDPHS